MLIRLKPAFNIFNAQGLAQGKVNKVKLNWIGTIPRKIFHFVAC